MTPETWDPTCTVITAFMVPVASTTSWISPRSTLAVKFWSCDLALKPKAAKMATTANTPAKISHLRFFFIHSPEKMKTHAGYYNAA
jgi:hypothetical protein